MLLLLRGIAGRVEEEDTRAREAVSDQAARVYQSRNCLAVCYKPIAGSFCQASLASSRKKSDSSQQWELKFKSVIVIGTNVALADHT